MNIPVIPTITFWKNNKIDQEYQVTVDTLINDFIKSKYNQGDWLNYPFDKRLNFFLMDYGSYDPFVKEQWKNIVDSYNFQKNLELYKDFI